MDIFSGIVMAGFGGVGWFAREVWGMISLLKQDILLLKDQVHMNFVRKDDFKEFKDNLMTTLLRIEDKIGMINERRISDRERKDD